MKLLKYVELKSGYSDNGPAWIGYVTASKTGRTLYFNGRALKKLKGHRRRWDGGNYLDWKAHEAFWISGVKKNGEDRHWAGSGKVMVEAAAVAEYLETTGAKVLDKARYEVTTAIRPANIQELDRLANSSWSDTEQAL